MLACDLDGIFDAQHACSANSDDVGLDSRLRGQKLKGGLSVVGPLLLATLPIRVVLVPGVAEATHVDGQRVDAGSRQLAGNTGPVCACSVALVEQQHSRARLGRGEVAGFQDGAVGAPYIHRAWDDSPAYLRTFSRNRSGNPSTSRDDHTRK